MKRRYVLHPRAVGHHKRRVVQVSLFVVLLLACLGVGLFIGLPQPSKKSESQTPKAAVAEPAVPRSITSKILFAGDIYWGRSMYEWSQASPLGYAYPFSGLSGFQRGHYDAWVGNLECPTVPGVTPTKQEERVLLKFNCDPAYLPEFAKWFDIVSLANNHTDNQNGVAGLDATRKELDKNKIQHFGHYDPEVLGEVCDVVSLPVTVELRDGSAKDGSLPAAFCGYHGVFRVPSTASLAVMQNYAKYMPVIAMPHMGVEYQARADSLRTNLFRKMIDNGADAVLAGHPHWVQNSESYNGKLIAYSLGNFIFDQQFEPDVMRGAVMTLELSLAKPGDDSQLAAWLELGSSCQAFADNCLEIAEKQNLKRLPFEFKWGMLASDSSGKLTKPADTDVSQAVANRLNWNQTATQLQPAGTPYPSQ